MISMANEVFSLYESAEFEQEVDNIEFDPIPVGEDDVKTVFIKNNTDHELILTELELETDDDISIKDKPSKIAPKNFDKITLSASPSSDNLSGLQAKMNIETQYIIQPEDEQ